MIENPEAVEAAVVGALGARDEFVERCERLIDV